MNNLPELLLSAFWIVNFAVAIAGWNKGRKVRQHLIQTQIPPI